MPVTARRRPAARVLVMILLAGAAGTACAGGTGSRSGDRAAPGPAACPGPGEASATTSIGVPMPGGTGSFAATPPAGMRPAGAPVQAGPALAGQALPTNQWWTSALTGPLSQPIWAHPLAVQATGGGLQVSSAAPIASANSVGTPFVPALTAGGLVSGLQVVGYGAFDVVLRARLPGGGTVEATIVQGSPLLYLCFQGVAPSVTTTSPPRSTIGGAAARLTVAGQRWDLLSDGGHWQRAGHRFTVSGAASGQVAVARVPDGVDEAAWSSAIAAAAADPVASTTATMAYDRASGTVTQTLTARRRSGAPGVWALLPHQQAGLVAGGTRPLAGRYRDALGALSLVVGDSVQVRVPMPGLLTGAPSVPLSGPARAALLADLGQDLAVKPGGGGSYFGLKELGRLATIAEIAKAAGATSLRRQAVDRLRPQLEDWLTYSGHADAHYFAYDRTWGGLIAVPAEFGSNDYNDHHFQYGYLVRAAAVLAESDPAFLRDYGRAVDLVAADYCGTTGAGGQRGFPAFRVFNPYLGHSAASGFAPFTAGNNQESSSEALGAWEAAVRWGLVTRDQNLVTYGVTHYAMEAATARMYWLGQGITRPAGYAHTVAGIVWDSKLDFATFFDPRPEAVVGIQLLPLTFGSLYRADPAAAAGRARDLAQAVPGPPREWGDLFAADLAAADPAAALRRLTPSLPREPSTSRAMVRYYVEMLAAFGPPQPAVTADGPYGMAFGRADAPTLAVVNPTGDARTVTFRRGPTVIAKIQAGPGQALSRRA